MPELPLRQKIRRAIRFFPPVAFFLYLLCRGLETAASITSPHFARGFARVMGKWIYPIDRWMRPLAEKHLRLVGFQGNFRNRIEEVYTHFILLFWELFRMARIMRSRTLPGEVELSIRPLEDAVARERGVILVGAHHGNWEVGVMAFALQGLPIHIITQPMKNPRIDRWLDELRGCTGIKMIPKIESAHLITRVLEQKGIVGIMVDLNARKGGIAVDFFGHPASTFRTPALLALRKDVPIVPVHFHRDKSGRIQAAAEKRIDPRDYRGMPDALRRMTQEYTTQLESAIRAHPGQWNWFYRRWRNVPTARRNP